MAGPAFGQKLVSDIVDRELKQARAILAVLGSIAVAYNLLALRKLRDYGFDGTLADRIKLGDELGIAIGVAYFVCAALVGKKPVVATVAGLVLYAVPLALVIVTAPTALLSPASLAYNAVILISLVFAVRFARVYEKNRAERVAQAVG